MIKNITKGGLLLALGILLPLVFHLIGLNQAGQVFLPMHIPVILSGFILGPIYGLMIGILTPIMSFIFTGMPTAERLIFMIGELAAYGFAAGLIYKKLQGNNRKYGIYMTLILAMIIGRLFYAMLVFVAGSILNMSGIGLIAVVNAIYTGIPGIIAQILIIPPIVFALEKGGFIEDERNIKQ